MRWEYSASSEHGLCKKNIKGYQEIKIQKKTVSVVALTRVDPANVMGEHNGDWR